MVKIKATKMDGTVVEKTVEKPRYGGTLTMVLMYVLGFDEVNRNPWYVPLRFTNEELYSGDWAKGPQGTGESTYYVDLNYELPLLTGELAESWEFKDKDTVIFHIRKGVRFHNKPPVNGRELTADDVVYSLYRVWHVPTSYHTGGYPWDKHFESVTATDKYTVEVKSKPGMLGRVWAIMTHLSWIVPREMVEKYGDLADWRNACGTGPFILTDYVPESSATFERNPNYWQKDPLHPQNQLPYVDGAKYVIIPDTSTRMAAVRTAKVDHQGGYGGPVSWEDARSLMKSNPELKYVRYDPGANTGIFFNNVHKTPPYNDVRVRKALHMAINVREIADTFYGGNAEIHGYPAANLVEFKDAYIPLDKLPESIQELYAYKPDKAKQLLAEAGYPNGFKTEIVCTQPYVDLLSIVKDYWAKIGVELKLDVKEAGVYSSMGFSRTFKHMYVWGVAGFVGYRMLYVLPGNIWNQGQVDDPKINEAIATMTPTETFLLNPVKKAQILKDITPYILEQAYHINLPGPFYYTFWQPWVKGYSGEIHVGYSDYYQWIKYAWLDLDMKESMTGAR